MEIDMPIMQFWAMSELDQAYFLAHRRASATMAAYDAMQAKKESSK